MAVVAVVVAASLVWGVLAARSSEVVSGAPGAETPPLLDGRAAGSIPSGAPAFPTVLSATDADRGDSVWFVLDRRGRRVHRFGASGALLGSFARAGEGPGELSNPSAIAVHRDTVVVADGPTVHLYEPSGAHVADRRVAFDGCLAPRVTDMESAALGLLFLVSCPSRAQAQDAGVFLATGDGRAQRLAARLPGEGGNVMNVMSIPVIGAHPGGFVFGDAHADCLGLFDRDSAPKESLCHDWMPRLPLSGQEREETESELGGLAGAAGLRMVVPRHFPPFDRVFVLDGGRLVYRALVQDSDGEVNAFRLVAQGEEGDATPLAVPVASEVFVSGGSALAAWEAVDAMHVAVYSLRGS